MSISTKLLSDQMVSRFSQISEEIQLRQIKISTGREITEAAEKPFEAIKLSALEEGLTQLEGFGKNVGTAQSRLSMGDTVLTSVDDILAQLRERAVAANSDTFSTTDMEAFRVEVSQLREALVGLANTQTSNGQALFGGYATDIVPFSEDANGRMQYRGDGGEHTLAVSETMRLPTSVNGGSTFMNVQTDDGIESVFNIVDSFEAALATDDSVHGTLSGSADVGLSLSFNGDRTPRDWSLTLEGPDGSVFITALEVVGGSNDRLLEAINERSDETGVAAASVDGRLELTASEGSITLSNLDIGGVTLASRMPQFTITTNDDPNQTMVPRVQLLSAQLEKITKAGQDVAISRTIVGARLQRANDQEASIQTRSVALESDVNELGSVDLEKVITELQTLLVMRDAARQAYSRISQGSLFDFLK
ncbi:FlgL-like flagellar hook associated protein [Octadecabacter antarcticus 307]|uniref:FlgL-like flagellar hook associated protein n=1 Tax=Octadecabacter antarcticus 307 TaxID=391626 RepID=M9R7C8_9RHOB|nr:flagellar hook-associated protein FlgL [Octadecabacter antarcticus]AGI68539.1 FlgL-like flagellar hook associated protein [Octadecabacter antarcticus 307]